MRIAISIVAACICSATAALAQIPHAGPDQTLLYPAPAVLAGTVEGGEPLRWWTGDGNGLFENYLFRYDEGTGVTPVGPLRTSGSGTFGFPTDLVRIGTVVYGVDALRRQIYTVDLATGIVSPIGTAWPATYADVESMTYDPVGDRLFAVDRATQQLLRIDRSNNAVTPVGASTLSAFPEIHSLAWRASDSRLYAVDQSSNAVLRIDPATGTPAILSHLPADPTGRIEELEFVGNRLYGVLAIDNGLTLVSARLQRVDPEHGVLMNVGPIVDQVSALCLLVDSLPEDHVWSKLSGPGNAVFSDPYSLTPTVTFSAPGTYVLKLKMLSGSSQSFDTVTITQTEWSIFTPGSETHTIYVSSSTGNDAWNGLAPDHSEGGVSGPKASMLSAARLLRDGYPDWLLFKAGDTFVGSIQDGVVTDHWVKQGRSASEPMLLSSYGSGARPLIASGTADGLRTWNQLYNGHYASNLAIVGLDFHAHTYTGGSENPHGLWLLGGGANLLVEDCRFRGYTGNIVIGSDSQGGAGTLTNVLIRRNVVVDAYTTVQDGGAQGLYASDVHGLAVLENVFDHNGWVDSIPGSGPNWFRRNVYIQNGCTGVVFRGNILAGTDGLQQRPGGICEDNLFLRNALALQFGSGNTPEPDGVTGAVRRNVILDGRDLQSGSPRGWGLIIGNAVNTSIDYNVVAHNVGGTAPDPYVLNFDNGHGNPVGLQNVLFDHNVIYDWSSTGRGAQLASYQPNTILNLVLTNNDVQNTVDTTYLLALSAPTRDILGQIHGAGNRWFRSSGNANRMFQLNNVDMSFQLFTSSIGDSTSTFGAVENYPDPTRTIGSYHASIGGTATLDAFMAEARLQSKANWRSQYTAQAVNTYIRAGFGL